MPAAEERCRRKRSMNRTRGKPPAGTYVGKIVGPMINGSRQRKSDPTRTDPTGNVPVHVKGKSGPVVVDGEYEFTGLTFAALDFFKELKEGDVFLFSVQVQDGFPKFGALMKKVSGKTWRVP